MGLGPPTSGSYTAGQIYTDSANAWWRYTGSQWVQTQAAVTNTAPSSANSIPVNYLISMPNQNWAQFYWTGSSWQPVNLQP